MAKRRRDPAICQQLSELSSRLPKLWCLATPVELQADCLAAVWGHRAQGKRELLDPGDVDQALQTASAIGDDRLQKEMQGYVVPDSFTHGTSEQRKRWFSNGFNSGQITACDTMSASSL